MMDGVLVTGASGFVGGALLPRLSKTHRVTAIARAPIEQRNASATPLEVLSIDLRDRAATAKALSPWRWGTVIHLAGPVPKVEQSWDESAETIAAHARLALHLTAAIPAEWPGRFIHVSSGVVYGLPVRDGARVSEDHPRRPLHPYALAKCLSEDIVSASALRDRWILRVGGLFSEHRRSGALFHFIRAAEAGEPLRVTSPTPPVPWEILHVDDAVESILRCMAAKGRDPGPINVGYGEPIQIVDIAKRIAKRAGRGSTVTLSGPEPPVFHADIAKAQRLIAWPPTTLGDRLEQLRISMTAAKKDSG